MPIPRALLVYGGIYEENSDFCRWWVLQKACHEFMGKKTAEKRASELYAYCQAHMKREEKHDSERKLYRIFYYDCPPLGKTVYHPLKKQGIDFRHSDTYTWTFTFFEQLKQQRKVALRLGQLSDARAGYNIDPKKLKDLCSGKVEISDLTEKDFSVTFEQKGVDMMIGVDIASVAFKKQVDQIILIAGDSDFVPASKLARREGIDFILDPMWSTIKDDLFEHIDGIHSNWKKRQKETSDVQETSL